MARRPNELLAGALAHEWGTLILIMALSIANVVLGIWRPQRLRRAGQHKPQPVASERSSGEDEEVRPAA